MMLLIIIAIITYQKPRFIKKDVLKSKQDINSNVPITNDNKAIFVDKGNVLKLKSVFMCGNFFKTVQRQVYKQAKMDRK